MNTSRLLLGVGLGVAAIAAVGLFFKYRRHGGSRLTAAMDSNAVKRKLSQYKRRAQREFDGASNPAIDRVTKWAGH